MEGYFIATEESQLRKDYLAYLQNIKDVNTYVKQFMNEQQIEESKYSVDSDKFYIIPNNDKWNNMFVSEDFNGGLKRFKKTSQIGKAWIKFVKENNIKFVRQPYIPFYFEEVCGHMSYNIFEINNIVYVYFKSQSNFTAPKSLKEIKASEYYKVIEDNKERFA